MSTITNTRAQMPPFSSIYSRRVNRLGQPQVNPLPCQRLTGGQAVRDSSVERLPVCDNKNIDTPSASLYSSLPAKHAAASGPRVT